jgi:hypothetical protein
LWGGVDDWKQFNPERSARFGNCLIFLDQLPALGSLVGFQNVVNVAGLVVAQCDALLSFDGLQGLHIVTQELRILRCDLLEDVSALSGVTDAVTASIEITSNSALDQCEALAMVATWQADQFVVGDNA